MIDHVGGSALGQEELSADIDLKQRLILFLGDLQKWLVECDPGVVDKEIEASQKVDGLIDQPENLANVFESG